MWYEMIDCDSGLIQCRALDELMPDPTPSVTFEQWQKINTFRTSSVLHVSCNMYVLFPESPESFSSGCHLEPESSDEALALQLQRELDREAAQAQTVNLEDRGLYFCHICHKDLTRMTSEGRTRHVNRCAHLLYLSGLVSLLVKTHT